MEKNDTGQDAIPRETTGQFRSLLGGITVAEPGRVLNVISEGGSGYHFFGKGAERTVIEAAPEALGGGMK
ncbi:MAG: DUF364 domain-containing protein [Geobacteraceae bacterium]|nr:DUF364 domain-containing protein [Geobacteraceae bacterium]